MIGSLLFLESLFTKRWGLAQTCLLILSAWDRQLLQFVSITDTQNSSSRSPLNTTKPLKQCNSVLTPIFCCQEEEEGKGEEEEEEENLTRYYIQRSTFGYFQIKVLLISCFVCSLINDKFSFTAMLYILCSGNQKIHKTELSVMNFFQAYHTHSKNIFIFFKLVKIGIRSEGKAALQYSILKT